MRVLLDTSYLYDLILPMQLDLESCGVRSFCESDASELARHANNRKVWLQLRDRFPHPYTIDDARGFIAFASGAEPETAFAVTVDGQPVGSIGVVLGEDVERCSAEVGYWLGESYWGRGIATRALVGFTRLAESLGLDAAALLRPSFDQVWNACGHDRSLNYDEKGNWNPAR